MNLYLIGAASLMIIALSSCATQTELMKQRVDAVPEDMRAYIIGRYAVECGPRGDDCRQVFNSISANYRNTVDETLKERLNSTQGSMSRDTVYDFVLPDQREKGYFFCQALPPGPYEFYSFSFYNFAGGGSGYSLREKDQFSLPFTLKPGVLLLSRDAGSDIETALLKCPEAVRVRTVRDASLRASMAQGSVLVHDEAAN